MAELTFDIGDITLTVPVDVSWHSPEERVRGHARAELLFEELAVSADGGFEGTADLTADADWIRLPDPAEATDGVKLQIHFDTEVVRQAGEALTGHITASKDDFDDAVLTVTLNTTPERRA